MRPAGALPLCYAPAENVAAQVFPVSGGAGADLSVPLEAS